MTGAGTLTAALIGTGMVADMHVAAVSGTGGSVRLKGAFSRTLASAQAFADRHDLFAYESVDAIAADAGVDFVLLATPPDARTDHVRVLVDTGKPILMEKPVERDLPRARTIVEMCEAADLPLGVLFQHRMRPAAKELARRLDDGMLGQIATVEVRVPWWRDQSYYDAPGRGTYDRDGGGVLITQAIHSLDLMLQLCGPVSAVQAMTGTSALHRLEAEDFASAAVTFEGGAAGALMASTTHFPGDSESISLNGTKGSATLSSNSLTICFHDGQTEVIGAPAATGGGADPMAFSSDWHRAVIEDFADALRQGRPPAISGRSALPVHALIDAIQLSSRNGTRVTPERIG